MSISEFSAGTLKETNPPGQTRMRVRRGRSYWEPIVRESYLRGVGPTASRHGVSRSQIYYWRSRVDENVSLHREGDDEPDFAQICVEEPSGVPSLAAISPEPAETTMPAQPSIELEFGSVHLKVPLCMGVEQIGELVLLLEAGR